MTPSHVNNFLFKLDRNNILKRKCAHVCDDLVILQVKMPKNGLQVYYEQKIEQIDVTIREKQQNVLRLEAQRNDWNNKGMLLFHRKQH